MALADHPLGDVWDDEEGQVVDAGEDAASRTLRQQAGGEEDETGGWKFSVLNYRAVCVVLFLSKTR